MTNRRPGRFTARRLSRRGALCAGGLGAAAGLGGVTLRPVFAQDATPAATFAEDPAQDGLSADVNELFDALPGAKGIKF
jgi:hypothetical protein